VGRPSTRRRGASSGPEHPSAVSLTMPGQGCPRPPAGSARIWLQRQCCSKRCRSHPPPRGGVSRENSRISWRMPRSNGPRALPPEGKGAPPEHRATTSRFMREASIHTGRTRNATPAALGRLGNEHHHHDRRARLDEKVRRGYHPRRGGRHDSEEDQSPLPEPPGPQAFSQAIRRARVPDPVPSPDYHHQVLRGNKAGTVACGLSAGVPAGWDGR
jgi:hypothetical protein